MTSAILANIEDTIFDSSDSFVGTYQYTAPEVLFGLDGNPRRSTCSDVYSFGGVMYQVSRALGHLGQVVFTFCSQTLSGLLPYHHCRSNFQVFCAIVIGIRPERPSEGWITDQCWEFIKRCWNEIPSERPTIHEIISYVSPA
jgi:serine/threonine protein kinase